MQVTVAEDAGLGSTLIDLDATVGDGGPAAAAAAAGLVYRFSRRTQALHGAVFAINATNGLVTVIGPLHLSAYNLSVCNTHTHAHAHPFNGPMSGTTQVSRYQKGKTWILLQQETVSGSGISWAVCKSAPYCRQITTPAPHHSVFYRPDVIITTVITLMGTS